MRFAFTSSARDADAENPCLPGSFFVGFLNEPCSTAFAFEELEGEGGVGGAGGGGLEWGRSCCWGWWCCCCCCGCSRSSCSRLRVELAEEGACAGFDQSVNVVFGDEGEGEVEDFVGCWVERGEVAVEEDGMEDA